MFDGWNELTRQSDPGNVGGGCLYVSTWLFAGVGILLALWWLGSTLFN